MLEFRPGRKVVSLAGHDKDRIYILLREEGNFVYLSDGRLKPVEKPKKKRKMHVRLMKDTELVRLFEAGKTVKNEEIRYTIKHTEE